MYFLYQNGRCMNRLEESYEKKLLSINHLNLSYDFFYSVIAKNIFSRKLIR